MTRIFDWLFVNQLFGANDRGETVFYPNGLSGRGYFVPAERVADVRAGVRRLVLGTLISSLAVFVLVPRMIESRLGFTLPLGWFIGVAFIALVAMVAAVIRCLSRLTVGLDPVSEPD